MVCSSLLLYNLGVEILIKLEFWLMVMNGKIVKGWGNYKTMLPGGFTKTSKVITELSFTNTKVTVIYESQDVINVS